MKEKRFSLIS